MFSDPARIKDAIENARFRAGDRVVLVEGPHKFVCGTFLYLKNDVEWAAIEQPDGQIWSHPVVWMQNAPDPMVHQRVQRARTSVL